jgi:hypothetical protein
MKKLLLVLTLVLIFLPVSALQTIKGKIVDGTSGRALDFVNVALIKGDSETPAAGVVSDEKGGFLLPKVNPGKYMLRISFVGYNTLTLPLNLSDKELDLGAVKLFENSKSLKEVEVVGQGTQMRFEIDKKVFSVDQNIAAAGGSATEVLQNIPSVDVDNEGNVSLRNSQAVEVWINGKPSGLTAENRAQILQQMPAESIESIEIMTNPSAKYNPEGTSGIINLVLKKNRKGGYFGSVSAGTMWTQGSAPGLNSGLNLNYSSGKVDAYVNLGYRVMNFKGGYETNRYFIQNEDTTSLLVQDNEMLRMYRGLFTRAGIDYRIADNHTISLSGFSLLGKGEWGSVTDNQVFKNTNKTNLLKDFSRINTATGGRPSADVSLDYKWDIDKLGSTLLSNLTYSNHSRYGTEIYLQQNNLNNDSTKMEQSAMGSSEELEFKVDYTKKFNENNRLELGWKSSLRNRFSPAEAYNLIPQRVELYPYFNEFDYNEQIHAAYMTYGNKTGNFSWQAGLRAEYFWRQPEIQTKNAQGTVITQTFDPKVDLELFPSFFASYILPQKDEIQLNISRRVNRPRGSQINPYKDFADSTNISYGNFDLSPEYTGVAELNYLKSWDNNSLSGTLYHRFTDGVIQGVSFLNGSVMESTYMNVTRSQNSGMELVLKNNLFKILNLTSSFNLYYNKMDSARYLNPYNLTQSVLIKEQENLNWSARVLGNVILGKNTFAQITAEYSSPRIIAQGRETASYAIDLGLRQTFLNRMLSVNLMARDILNTRRRNTIIEGDGFYQTSKSYFHGRMLGVVATYNFGNMKPKKVQQRQEGQGEMNFEE